MSNRKAGITKFAKDTTAVIADAKKMRDDIEAYCKENDVTVSPMLVRNDIAGSTISNSVRSYWLLMNPGKKMGDWVKGKHRAYSEGFEIGIFRKDVFYKICKIFNLDPKKYFIRFNEDKPKEEEKEEEPAKVETPKEGYHRDYGTDLFDIKELLRVNNILLEQLIKKWS